MNLLAHVLLAGEDPDLRFGSLIGDFVRGAIDPALPAGVRAGVALHRAVDAYTDAHPDVVAARRLFAPPLRRYAGIVLDVWFDHLLARDWARLGDGTLQGFSSSVQALLQERSGELPPRMRGFAAYLLRNDLPQRYRERPMIAQVFVGLSTRITRANPVAVALPAIAAREQAIDARFEAFLPDLRAYAARERERLAAAARGGDAG